MIADLKALRRAPLADPYIGPAILEGRAAGVFFHEIFGHRVEGHRQKNDEEGQTFAKKIGEPIMPSFISVYDDPTLARIGDVDLNGFYRFDDEGVVAQRATLVDGGVLKGFLLSRSPTRGFHQSNGHGRRQEGRAVTSRQGNLVVEPKVAVPVAELRRRLREEAQRQGKPYGLLFRDISGGFTNTARGGPQAFKVLPIIVYRVWVDGRPDELVRGVDLVGTPLVGAVAHHGRRRRLPDVQRLLRRRVGLRARVGDEPEPARAADRDRAARQGQRQAADPVSAADVAVDAAPPPRAWRSDVASRRAGLRDASRSCSRVALACPPARRRRARACASTTPPCAPRCGDELARSTAELRLGDEPRPYYVAYTISDAEQATVSATFGAVTAAHAYRGRAPAHRRARRLARLRQLELRAGRQGRRAARARTTTRRCAASCGCAATRPTSRRSSCSRASAPPPRARSGGEDDPRARRLLGGAAREARGAVPRRAPSSPRRCATRRRKLSAIFRDYPALTGARVTGTLRRRAPPHALERGHVGRRRAARRAHRRRRRDAGRRRHEAAQLRAVQRARARRACRRCAEMEKAVRAMATELVAMRTAPVAETGAGAVLFEGLAAGAAHEAPARRPPRGHAAAQDGDGRERRRRPAEHARDEAQAEGRGAAALGRRRSAA